MNVFTKVLVVLVLLLSAAFAGSQMVLHSKRVEYYQLYEKADGDLELAQGRVKELEGERNDLARKRDDISLLLAGEREARQSDRTQLESQVNDLRSALSTSNDALSAAGLQIDTLVAMLDTQVARITELVQANYDFKDGLRMADAAIKALQDDVRARNTSIQKINADMVQLSAEMQDVTTERDILARAVAQAKVLGFDFMAEDVPIIDAKVLDVDPSVRAVVLNKGSDDGVKMNFPFTISRDLEYVAKVTVVEVHPELSVAHVVPGFEEILIEIGYDASTRR